MTLTPEQEELVCRELAKLMGEDPEKIMRMTDPDDSTKVSPLPRWKFYLTTLRFHVKIHDAIQKVAGSL